MTGIRNPIKGVVYAKQESARSYFASGSWVDLTVGQALRRTAQRYPDRPAFISDSQTITFLELDQLTDRLGAALLDLGLNAGDRAIFQMGTNIDTVIALVSCYKVGILPVCSIHQYREIEISELVEKTKAKSYFVQAGLGSFDLVGFAQSMMTKLASLEHLIVAKSPTDTPDYLCLETLMAGIGYEYACQRIRTVTLGSEDVLSFQLSGGSTGVPKIIPRFHAEYLGHSAGWMRRYEINSDHRVMLPLPLIHNAGQVFSLMPALLLGVTGVLMEQVDIGLMLELIDMHQVTHVLSIGPIRPKLMAYEELERHSLTSLELFITMSGASELEHHLGVPCSNLYGITEGLLLGSPASASSCARHQTQGTSGCLDDSIYLINPESNKRVGHGEVGEMCIKGPSSLRQYYENPEANAQAFMDDGYFRTGDMVSERQIEGRTYYVFEGRLRDNINRGGEKIGCEQVEAYVSRHPAVIEAKLVPVPDPIYTEKGSVFLILGNDAMAPTVQELAEFLVDQGLAKFKCPERIEVISEFPTTRVGKLDKVALRRMAIELMETEIQDE